MKNIYITVVVLVVIIAGAFFLSRNKTEAPAPENGTVESQMPVLGSEGQGVEEMIVDEVSTVKEFTVSGQNFSFNPSTITVKKGDTVKITFKSTQGFHDFVVDEYGVATKQMQAPAEEVIEFVADKAGSFEYYCSVGSHRTMGMKGTLVVEE